MHVLKVALAVTALSIAACGGDYVLVPYEPEPGISVVTSTASSGTPVCEAYCVQRCAFDASCSEECSREHCSPDAE